MLKALFGQCYSSQDRVVGFGDRFWRSGPFVFDRDGFLRIGFPLLS